MSENCARCGALAPLEFLAPPELSSHPGSVCSECGRWVCDDCVDWFTMGELESEVILCVDCARDPPGASPSPEPILPPARRDPRRVMERLELD
jgi:hypothetical protein